MTTAAALTPGDTFTLPSGASHTAVEVHRLSHRISVSTTVGVWVTLFPTVRVRVASPTMLGAPVTTTA